MLDLLAVLADHDRMTRGHSTRVSAYSDMIAEEMGLSSGDRDKLHWAALLHDIGKLEVPREVLNKDGTISAQFKFQIAAAGVVLSEFRTQGPGGGFDEFIEIFNSGSAGVDLTGWQFRVTGIINSDFYNFPAVVLEPGQHFLVSHASGPLAGTADDTWSGLNYGTWGDIVLKDDTGTPVDIVGFDSGGNPILFEGIKLPSYPGGAADVSYERLAGSPSANCVDTDDNAADWFLSALASPQTQSDPKVAC